MKAEWLANVNGQEYGPYTWKQMLQMAAEGRVPADLPVKRVSDKQWFTAKQVPGLVEPARPVAPAANAAPPRPAKDDSQLKRAKPLTPLASSVAPPAPSSSPPPTPPPPPPPPPVAPAIAPAIAPGGALGLPVIITEAPRVAASTLATTPPADHVPRRRTNRWMLVGILGSVAAVILVAGGVVVWLVWMRGGTAALSDQVVAAAAQQKSEPDKQNAGGSAGNASTKESADEETKSEPGSGPTKAELAAQVKIVRSISTWTSLAVSPSATVSNANIRVTRVWRTEAAANEDEKESGAKYVCVEVAIQNKSRSPLKYRGWNSYGANGAILADEEKNVLPLVPASKTPSLSRMTDHSVPGNGSVTEVLVFDAPDSEDEVLYLVLPYGVFYSNVKPSPYRALELTPDVMGIDLAEASAATPPAADAAQSPEVAAGAGPAGTEPPEGEAPRTSPPGANPATKDGKPESLRDQIKNEPEVPATPDDPRAKKGKREKEKGATKQGEKPQTPKKPENPLDPKDAANPLDPLSVVPKGAGKSDEP